PYACRPQTPGAHHRNARPRRRTGRARRVHRGPAPMSSYERPPELYDGLRLHQNENTGGCSPRVLEALARLRADQIGFYPPYTAATDAVANYLDVPAELVTLVNGLDEGIMALSVAYLRPSPGSPVFES